MKLYKLVLSLLVMVFLVSCAAQAVEEPAEREVVVTRIVEKELVVTEIVEVAGEETVVESEVVETEVLAVEGVSAVGGDAAAPPIEGELAYAVSDDEASNRQQSLLKAGEVDDNLQWDDYLLYRRQYGRSDVHDVDVSERYVITVLDAAGHTVHNALVTVSAGQEVLMEAIADASGRVLFHPRAFPLANGAEWFMVSASDPAEPTLTSTAEFAREPVLSWEVTLPGEQVNAPVQLDVLFLIDTTGSMDDEIDALKSSILEISAQIDALPERPDLQFGMVIYRDRGDVYVTRSYDFGPDVNEFHRQLQAVTANGGDDYPESLNEGLHVALHDVTWRESKTVRLVFLIADAPPHLDYPQDYDYAEEMVYAAGRGIKVFPIASSGLDDQGEYIFRQIAQFTGGKFIFLTYSEGGDPASGPGEETSHHVDDYSVQNLEALVVQLVQQELAKLSR